MFRLRPKPVPDMDITAMESLWKRYATTDLNAGRAFEEQHDVVARSKVEEIHAWEDWALANYNGPLGLAAV